MKEWVMLIFALNGKLAKLTEMIDRQVGELSLLCFANTMELYDEIIELNNKKIKLINLRVLHDKMVESLTPLERKRCHLFAHGATITELAAYENIHRSTLCRKMKKTLIKLESVLEFYGYNAERMEREYGKWYLVERTRRKLMRKESCLALRIG